MPHALAVTIVCVITAFVIMTMTVITNITGTIGYIAQILYIQSGTNINLDGMTFAEVYEKYGNCHASAECFEKNFTGTYCFNLGYFNFDRCYMEVQFENGVVVRYERKQENTL